MAEQSMRERADWETASMRARVAAVIQAGVINEHTFTQIADAVLAEIETPTEGMIQAATEAYEEWCQDEDTFSVAKLAELMLAAAIRAAREGR